MSFPPRCSPVPGTSAGFRLPGDQPCGERQCWKASGTKGYRYQDKAAGADGISKVGYGDAGKGKANASGANNAAKSQASLPTGIAAALSGNTTSTMQLITDNGLCIGATLTVVTEDGGGEYSAQKE